MSVEHIEIADTTEPGPEPFELPTQAVDPTRIEERATGSEDGPGSADRHSHLVDVLGIASGAGAWPAIDAGAEAVARAFALPRP